MDLKQQTKEMDELHGPAYQALFATHHERFRQSASQILPVLLNWLQISSILDVGCGQGAWLLEAKQIGIKKLYGLDGPWVDSLKLKHHGVLFTVADLSKPLKLPAQVDLAICMEVAEHLPSERANSLVQELISSADVVLFSAAIPGQGGTGHVNEQWPSYWAKIFQDNGFNCFDIMRPLFWRNEQVGWWYRQNMMLFATGEKSEILSRHFAPVSDMAMLDIVHPDHYEKKNSAFQKERRKLHQAIRQPTLRQLVGYAMRWLCSAVQFTK